MEIDIKRFMNCGPVPTVCFETTQMSGIIFVKKKNGNSTPTFRLSLLSFVWSNSRRFIRNRFLHPYKGFFCGPSKDFISYDGQKSSFLLIAS